MKENFYDVDKIAEILGVSHGHAYKIIRELNRDLKKQGFITIAGKVSKEYFDEHFYKKTGLQEN